MPGGPLRSLADSATIPRSLRPEAIYNLKIHGSFRKLGVPYLGVLMIGSYYLGYYVRVPYFRKPPHAHHRS